MSHTCISFFLVNFFLDFSLCYFMFLEITSGGATVSFRQLASTHNESSDHGCRSLIVRPKLTAFLYQLSTVKVWWRKDVYSAQESSSEQALGLGSAAMRDSTRMALEMMASLGLNRVWRGLL